MRISAVIRVILTAITVATAVQAYRTRQAAGHFYGVPYDFRMPTIQRVRDRWWNQDDPRLLTPHVFGVGWSINLYQLRERLMGFSPPRSDQKS